MGVDRTPTHDTHVCSAVCSQARNAHTTHLAQELHCHLCAPEKNLVIWCVPCLILGCLACLSPRALHLPHFIFLLRHKNTLQDRYNKSNSENTPYIPHISKLPQSTSCAIKNHSGVKTGRVAETRAPQLLQITSPKNLRLSQGSKLLLEIHINYMMYMKKLEKKITELLSPKKWRNSERLGRLACHSPKYQRRPTSNRKCISPWKALQIQISKIESYKRSFGETRCIGRAGEIGKCTIHSRRSKGKFEVSLI